jgi:hypothetical protein
MQLHDTLHGVLRIPFLILEGLVPHRARYAGATRLPRGSGSGAVLSCVQIQKGRACLHHARYCGLSSRPTLSVSCLC